MVVIHSTHSFISSVEDGMALGFALFLEQGAIGDVAGLRGDVERAVELVEALVDQVELVAAAGQHARAEERDQVADEGEDDGEDGSVLQEIRREKLGWVHCVDCLADEYTHGSECGNVIAATGDQAVPVCYLFRLAGLVFAGSGMTLISKSFGQSLPVTKRRSCSGRRRCR